MATTLADVEVLVRRALIEATPRFWSSDELISIIGAGIRDLWRSTVDLKQEYYLKTTVLGDVTYNASADRLTGVPPDVHKVYLIEAYYVGSDQVNNGLIFQPRDRNHRDFMSARSSSTIDPANDTIYYAITGAGGPVNPPVIYCAPSVSSQVYVTLIYVPTLGDLDAESVVPIPGEADNALVAWTVAYARAKERQTRDPDPTWLTIYATEKQNLLESLGLRQYQEPTFVDAIFQEYWELLLAMSAAALPFIRHVASIALQA